MKVFLDATVFVEKIGRFAKEFIIEWRQGTYDALLIKYSSKDNEESIFALNNLTFSMSQI